MVRLLRGLMPPALAAKAAVWTQRWIQIHAGQRDGDWATKAAKDILRDELHKLACGKCAFCESVLGLTSYKEIEHYWPKTLRPNAAFDWTNLLPVCRVCNGEKQDTDHRGSLIKPDDEDPNGCSGSIRTTAGCSRPRGSTGPRLCGSSALSKSAIFNVARCVPSESREWSPRFTGSNEPLSGNT